LYLVQGGGSVKIEQLQGLQLRARQLALRWSRGLPLCHIAKHTIRVVDIRSMGARARTGGALAERPGWAVTGQSLVAEAFDLCFRHARKIIPRLIVGARVFEAEPQMLV